MYMNLQLQAQRLVETDGCELGGAVVDEAVGGELAGQGGDGQDVARVPCHHVLQERLARLSHTTSTDKLHYYIVKNCIHVLYTRATDNIHSYFIVLLLILLLR